MPLLCEQCVAAPAQEPTSPIQAPGASAGPIPISKSSEGVRTFAEGIRIDWPTLTVEIDAEVVLREGPLELFACSPKTREHESIVRISARPLHIFQAMGLIGLTPGRPLRFDEEAKRWVEPSGDRVELRVRYLDGRGTHILASEQWVSDSKGQDPARPIVLDWIFTGSITLPDGRFAADADGTIACLVDFESALIALAARHTADNEELWLVANTKEIPPRGTKCTLLIGSRDWRPTVEVALVNEHTARYKNELLTAEQLANVLRPPPDDRRPGRLIIHLRGDVADDDAKAFMEKIRKSGWHGTIETKRHSSETLMRPG